MILKFTIGVLLILRCGVAFAQLGGNPEKAALKNMARHRWEKAELKLRQALRKDAVNASVRYVLSAYYFHSDNPAFDLDSAYHYAITAMQDYQLAAGNERDKLERRSIDSLRITGLRENIDSAAFEEARNTNTEAAYLKFLRQYTSASQRDLATELRDEVAFQSALKENSHEAFFRFLNRYPGAKRASEAHRHYERLLYRFETQDKRLSSFEKFLTAHPETPYRPEIYRQIFEISTADGSVESLLNFVDRYPISDLVTKARQMVFHILADEENPQWPRGFLNDSLQHLLSVQNTYLVPVLRNSLYGFIDENGQEIIPPVLEDIHPEYLCGNVRDEVLRLDNQLIARNGSVVYNGKVDEITDLGIGFLEIKAGDNTKVIHKAGFVFADSIEDARILSKRYITVKKNSAWLLFTLAGRRLDEKPWDDITTFQDVIVLRRGGKVYLSSKTQLGLIAEGNDIKLSAPFDEVKKWPDDLMWVKIGKAEGLLDQQLQQIIPLREQTLTQTFFGAIAARPEGLRLYNRNGQESSTFEQVSLHPPWVAVKKQRSWLLFEPHRQTIESNPYDTIKAEGPFVMGYLTDTVYVYFADNRRRRFVQPLKIAFVPGKDSTSFLLVQEKENEKSIYDLRGRKLFSASFDGIEYAGKGIFVITRKDKKGLMNTSGRMLLPAEFDAIGSVQDQVVSLLQNKRFGCYHIRYRKLIKPQYSQNLHPYTDNMLTTLKDGYYGLIGWDNKPVSAFEFEEIKYWDDSIALVRKGSLWNFYHISSKQMKQNNLRNVLMLKNSADEKIAIVQKDNAYGVLSNRRDVVIPISFSEVINLGTSDAPMYFTEKHIREAALFIVIYYDRFGSLLRKEIYDDAGDYDKIYCSDN